MYCGTDASIGLHLTCISRLDLFRRDLLAVPAESAWMVFQAFENGAYGSPDEATGGPGMRLPPKRGPGRPRGSGRVRLEKHPKFEDYTPRMLELLHEGYTHRGCAKKLSREGFFTPQGKEITVDTIRMRLYNLRKAEGA